MIGFMRKNKKNKLAPFIGAMLLTVVFAACSKDRGKVVFTTGFEEDELFRIGEVSCSLPEYMIYLTNMQNKYEEAFGEDVWNITFENTDLEDNVKDIALAQIAQMKSVYLLAQQSEVELDSEEEDKLEKATKEYVTSLSETELEAMGVTATDIRNLYREYALAQKVYEQIVSQVNPEISDDEARTVVVEQIYIKTHVVDGSGKIIEYSASTKEECLGTMQEIHEALVTEGKDFTELAGKYSESEDIRLALQKGDAIATIDNVVFNLRTDEISDIVETAEGYYIFKCISTLDRAQTDANKLVIVEQRKKDAFEQEYDAFVNTLARKLNEKLWKKVELIHVQGVDTSNFFAVYNKYFQ